MLGRGPRPGVERSGTPGTAHPGTTARGAGDSPEIMVTTVARSAGWHYLWTITWGSAALHPRLYAFTRFAG